MPHLLQKNADLTKARQRLRNSEISTGEYRKLTRDAGRQFDLRCARTTLNHPQPPVRPPPTHSRARRMRTRANQPRAILWTSNAALMCRAWLASIDVFTSSIADLHCQEMAEKGFDQLDDAAIDELYDKADGDHSGEIDLKEDGSIWVRREQDGLKLQP